MSSQGSFVNVHPLVLVNVSDHMLRCRCDLDTGDATRLVVGILFGVQEGLSIHIVDSVEIKCVIEQEKLQVDKSFVSEKLELTTQVFPDYDLVGWYAVDDVVSDKHMQIHQSLFEFNESPFLMFLDRAFLSEDKDLQVQLFESATKVVNQSPELVFERLNFNIETNPSEKIIVDNAVKGGIDDDMFSSVHSQLMDLRTSVENLLNRLSILIKYLKMFKAGEIEGNFDTLRTIAAISHSLPVLNPIDASEEFKTLFTEGHLQSLLSFATKGVVSLATLQKKIDEVPENDTLLR